jgi:hypothetical protein
MAVGRYMMSVKAKERLATWLGPVLTAGELLSGEMIGE